MAEFDLEAFKELQPIPWGNWTDLPLLWTAEFNAVVITNSN